MIVVATWSYIGSGYQSTKDVERFLTGIGNDKLRGTWTDPTLGRVLLADWYVLWRRATLELRPNTEARDERLFRLHILPRFGSMSLVAITQYEVRAWVTQASRQGLAASTVRRAYQLLGKVMAAAVDAGMIAQNPLSSGAAAEDRASGDALSYPG